MGCRLAHYVYLDVTSSEEYVLMNFVTFEELGANPSFLLPFQKILLKDNTTNNVQEIKILQIKIRQKGPKYGFGSFHLKNLNLHILENNKIQPYKFIVCNLQDMKTYIFPLQLARHELIFFPFT